MNSNEEEENECDESDEGALTKWRRMKQIYSKHISLSDAPPTDSENILVGELMVHCFNNFSLNLRKSYRR